MFVSKNLIRMHDIDMVGILYFPRQFRFVHEAMEDFLESEGYRFDRIMREEDFVFVLVHCESDYIKPLKLGDLLVIHVIVDSIGTTSFTMGFQIFKEDGVLTGTAKTVYVCLNSKTRQKIPIPPPFKKILIKHLAAQGA